MGLELLRPYRKLRDYLETSGYSKSEARSALKGLDRKDLKLALENIDLVPDWHLETEGNGLRWARQVYPGTVLNMVINHEPVNSNNILIRICDSWGRVTQDARDMVEKLASKPTDTRVRTVLVE